MASELPSRLVPPSFAQLSDGWGGMLWSTSSGDIFSEYKTRMSVAVAFSWLAWVVGVAQVGCGRRLGTCWAPCAMWCMDRTSP